MPLPKKYETSSAQKRARAARDKMRHMSRVNIGPEIHRWNDLKTEQNLSSDSEVACLLIDCYNQSKMTTSTPIAGFSLTQVADTASDSVSSVGAISCISGVERIGSEHCDMEVDVESGPNPASIKGGAAGYSTNDISYQPCDESLEVYLQESHINKKMYHTEPEELEELEEEDLVHFIEEQDQEVSSMDSACTSDAPVIHDATNLLEDSPFLAYTSCLLELISTVVPGNCTKKGCRSKVLINSKYVGTALVITWVCQKNHKMHQWSSQPLLSKRGVNGGDFMLATSILLSGNNHCKIALLMKFLGLKPMSRAFFYRIQRHYMVPSINQYWEELLAKTLASYREQDLVLAGDGRNDSPGHSSQFCTYTLMEEGSSDIMALVSIDKREVNLRSPNMEPLGLRRALSFLQEKGLTVKELVTDAHSQIPPILRELGILHQWDVWHGSKNLGKKLNQASSSRDSKELGLWCKDIVRHFWTAAEHAKGSPDVFKSTIRGCLHHVVNKHSWISGDGVGPGECLHEPLSAEERDKPWLEVDSPAHTALRKILLDKTWLNHASEKYKNFRHTGDLEIFHHHLLMYAPKRNSFSPPVYHARVLLAAIDYQQHKERPYLKKTSGEQVYRRIFNKRSDNWFAVPLRVAKDYGYIKVLQQQILLARMADPEPMTRRATTAEDDPRNIRPTIASIDPRPVSVLVEEHQSRLGRNRLTGNEPSD